MFCTNCGAKLSSDAKFCYNCGNQVKQVSQSPFEGIEPNANERYFSPIERNPYQNYAQAVFTAPVVATKEDKTNAGLVVLSFLMPLLALFFYFNNKYYAPKSARVYGFSGIVGVFLQVLFFVVVIAVNAAGTIVFNMPL